MLRSVVLALVALLLVVVDARVSCHASPLLQRHATAATATTATTATTASPTLLFIWPQPQSLTAGSGARKLASPFSITGSPDFSDLDDAIARYLSLIFSRPTAGTTGSPALGGLTINVASLSAPLQQGVDESYELDVPLDPELGQATLSAATYYGALRGLETFSQLVQFNFTDATYYMENLPLHISDAPRFPHRGLMLDTSRHYQPIAMIKRVLDSMSYAKFNVFHWHLSDIQLLLCFFILAAYSPADRYSIYDVADVIEYARLRGIRVVMEFDVPGHASSWCVGYPDVCPSPTCLTPLDPSTENLFDLLATLFNDFTGSARGAGVAYENLFHLGGDEVDTTCWTDTPRIAKWLAANNYTADQAYMYVVERAQKIVSAQGRDPINWEEVYNHFGTKLPKSTVIQIWLNKTTLASASADGYRVLLSNVDAWYLGPLTTTWQTFYLNEPLDGIIAPAQQALVLGGEVCMWGETADASDVLQTIWPRAAAAAERLWSARAVNDTTAALPRLSWFRCLLNDRGIPAAPTMNAVARSAPPGPGACLAQ